MPDDGEGSDYHAWIELKTFKLKILEKRVELLPYPALLLSGDEGNHNVAFPDFRSGCVQSGKNLGNILQFVIDNNLV